MTKNQQAVMNAIQKCTFSELKEIGSWLKAAGEALPKNAMDLQWADLLQDMTEGFE